MRRFKFALDRKAYETIYLSFARPLLGYADIAWDNCTNYEKEVLDKFRMQPLEYAHVTQSSYI